jgi:hypothetical protein
MIQTTSQQTLDAPAPALDTRSNGLGVDSPAESLLPDPQAWGLMPDLHDSERINAVNPQRFEMHQLDGVLSIDDTKHEILGYKQLEGNPFISAGQGSVQAGPRWIEVAAQASAYYLKGCNFGGRDINFGIGGIYDLEFHRAQLTGRRMYVLARATSIDAPTSARVEFEGFVDSTLFFSGGMLLLPLKCLERAKCK